MHPDWRAYPQGDDAHASRPWWRRVGLGWVRTDGAAIDHALDDEEAAQAMAAWDEAQPLPAPQPRCGQVWVFGVPHLGAHAEGMVVGVDAEARVTFGASVVPVPQGGVVSQIEEWPPPGGCLVAGPGAPWAPPDTSAPRAPPNASALDAAAVSPSHDRVAPVRPSNWGAT